MDNQQKIYLTLLNISKILAILSIIIGSIVFIGWMLNIDILKSVFPGMIPMKFNPALGFILTGVSLLCILDENIKSWKKYLVIISCAPIIIFGLLTIGQFVLNKDMGIDQLVYRALTGHVPNEYEFGSVPPVTAVNFLLISISILLIYPFRRYGLSQFFGLLVLIFSLTGILGYMYGVKDFMGMVPYYDEVAFIALLSFFALSLSIIFIRPSSGFVSIFSADDNGGTVSRICMPLDVVLLFVLGYVQIIWHENFSEPSNIQECTEIRFHIAFLVLTAVIIFNIIIWIVARLLHNADLEKKIVYDKLKVEKEKTETFLSSIGDAVIIIDREWNVISWNNAASLLSGWAKEEVIGKPLRKFIKIYRERDRSECFQFIEDVMLTGKVKTLENHAFLITKEGQEKPIGDSAAPILDKNNDIIGAVIIMRDATNERRAALLHSDFAYASHQLRTPINKAMWMLETAMKSNDTENIREVARESYKAMESISRLSEQLINVSEIDQLMVIPKVEAIKIVDLIDEVIKEVGLKATECGVKINVPPVSITASINVCKKMLKRVLFEVLNNAVIYSPRNSEINIAIMQKEGSILFEIQDSGIGINLEHQPLVFQKFFRGSNFNTDKIPGAGLGLHISREYIKLLNGRMWFNSEPGTGSTFYILLPLA